MATPHTLADWQQPAYARAWASQDVLADMLDFPRRIAAAIVGHDRTPQTVIDIGSGPGAFLEVFLEAFPDAHGVWTDASEAMRELGTGRLSRFGDRVSYRIAEMTDLGDVGTAGAADVLLSSRASHHLDTVGLALFYAQAAGRLRDGGWMVNLDHIGPAAEWDSRYRAVRPRFTPPRRRDGQGHTHTHPSPSLVDHVAGLASAGFGEVDIVWKAFGTVLLMGRKVPGAHQPTVRTSGGAQ